MSRRLLEEVVGASLGEHPALPEVPVARPETIEQAGELLRLASRDGLGLTLLGHGTKLGWSLATGRPDFALSTARLAGVVEFEPGDGTLTALAGTSMAELDRLTREAGLALTPDVPRPGEATLGGTIAAGASGADRLALGPSRLHVLGTRGLRLDGEAVRSGGKLVKNVTGFDLQRLYAGSFGSLLLLTEASLRLAPAPEVTVVLRADVEELTRAVERCGAVLEARVAPRSVAIENVSRPGSWRLHVVLAGRAPHVELEAQRVGAALGELDRCEGEAGVEQARWLRDLEPDAREGEVLHVGAPPSRLKEALGEVLDALGPQDGLRALVRPGLATVDLASGPAEASLTPERLRGLRDALRPLGASATLRRARPLDPELAPEVTDSLRARLGQRLRRAYDPRGLLRTRPPLEPLA